MSSRKDNILYAATDDREIIRINTYSLLAASSRIPGTDPFKSIYEDRAGQLWIEPANHGIVKYNPVTNTFRFFFQENDATIIYPFFHYAVFEDTDNRVWVSMKGGGFGYYKHCFV